MRLICELRRLGGRVGERLDEAGVLGCGAAGEGEAPAHVAVGEAAAGVGEAERARHAAVAERIGAEAGELGRRALEAEAERVQIAGDQVRAGQVGGAELGDRLGPQQRLSAEAGQRGRVQAG